MNKQYVSNAMEAVHEMATGLHEHGLISKKTMREFDAACLMPIEPMRSENIRQIRDKVYMPCAEQRASPLEQPCHRNIAIPSPLLRPGRS